MSEPTMLEKYEVKTNNFGLLYNGNSVAWRWVSGFSAYEFKHAVHKHQHMTTYKPHVWVALGNSPHRDFMIYCDSHQEAISLADELFHIAHVHFNHN